MRDAMPYKPLELKQLHREKFCYSDKKNIALTANINLNNNKVNIGVKTNKTKIIKFKFRRTFTFFG